MLSVPVLIRDLVALTSTSSGPNSGSKDSLLTSTWFSPKKYSSVDCIDASLERKVWCWLCFCVLDKQMQQPIMYPITCNDKITSLSNSFYKAEEFCGFR